MDDTRDFYLRLPGFEEFAEFPHSNWYRPLPDDWYVVISDVRGSTKAIERGRYKHVNAVGVASIAALMNAVKPLCIPYVFGGDGATACVPRASLESVRRALTASRCMALEQFGLALRIGVVPMSEIYAAGHAVLVAKHRPHPHYQQAMFLGDGLHYAEACLKDPRPENPYLIADDSSVDGTFFEGFECRWNEIPSPKQENVALLVSFLGEDNSASAAVYAEILEHIEHIYGKDFEYHPLCEPNLSLTASFKLLSVEAGIRSAFRPAAERYLYLLKLQLLRLAGKWLMARKVRTAATDWGLYKHRLIVNTDYRKLDESLRMVISGSEGQRSELRAVLDGYRLEGEIAFGIFASDAALITCIVQDYENDHVHFLDGAAGGYAMAARELKKQCGAL